MKNRVGLGTFPLANVFNEINPDQAKQVVREFINAGGYYIDTAPMYGFGEVESLLGEVLKEYPRNSFYMITKCGYKDVEGKTFQTIPRGASYKDVLQECDESLKRLRLEYIDLYFVHSPDPSVPFDETMKALDELMSQGKIKAIGVSNVNLEELKKYNKNGQVSFIQNRFSLLNQSIEPEFQTYLRDYNIKLIPYQVIDRGQLTGSLIEGVKMREGDLRIGRSDWLEEKSSMVAEWSKEYLLPIAKKINITLGQLAMAWALHQAYMGFIIVGTTKAKYIDINLKADKIQLSGEVLEEIGEAHKKLENTVKEKYNQSLREFRGLNEKYY